MNKLLKGSSCSYSQSSSLSIFILYSGEVVSNYQLDRNISDEMEEVSRQDKHQEENSPDLKTAALLPSLITSSEEVALTKSVIGLRAALRTPQL